MKNKQKDNPETFDDDLTQVAPKGEFKAEKDKIIEETKWSKISEIVKDLVESNNDNLRTANSSDLDKGEILFNLGVQSQNQKIIEEIKSLDYDEMMSEDMETVDKKMFYESSMTEEDLESVKKYILKSIGEKEQ